MSGSEAVLLASQIPGWMSQEELGWLYARAQELPPDSTWVEVGVWKGRSLLVTALGLPLRSHIVGVDTFLGSPESVRHSEARLPGNPVRQRFYETLEWIRQLRPDLEVCCIEEPSIVAAQHFHRVDACFLDGGHLYETLLSDLGAWLPKISEQGLLCGHDLGNFDGVERALREQPFRFSPGPGSIWRRE